MANQKVVRTLTGFLLFQFGMGFRVRHSLKQPTVVWGTEGWVSGGNGHVRLNEGIVELRWNLIVSDLRRVSGLSFILNS